MGGRARGATAQAAEIFEGLGTCPVIPGWQEETNDR